jgi:hypothetical protein
LLRDSEISDAEFKGAGIPAILVSLPKTGSKYSHFPTLVQLLGAQELTDNRQMNRRSDKFTYLHMHAGVLSDEYLAQYHEIEKFIHQT